MKSIAKACLLLLPILAGLILLSTITRPAKLPRLPSGRVIGIVVKRSAAWKRAHHRIAPAGLAGAKYFYYFPRTDESGPYSLPLFTADSDGILHDADPYTGYMNSATSPSLEVGCATIVDLGEMRSVTAIRAQTIYTPSEPISTYVYASSDGETWYAVNSLPPDNLRHSFYKPLRSRYFQFCARIVSVAPGQFVKTTEVSLYTDDSATAIQSR